MTTQRLTFTIGTLVVMAVIGLFAALFAASPASAEMTGDGMECSKGAVNDEEAEDCNTSGQT